MDGKDRQIVRALQANARMTNQDLAAAVNLSPSPCLRRLRNLEDSGVIRGYSVDVDAKAYGLPMTVFIRIRLERHTGSHIQEFEARIRAIDEVLECHLMTGPADYLLRVVVAGLDHYEDFIRNRASAGRVLSLVDMRIEDDDGNELPAGTPGEIVVRGPVVMQGYWQNKEATDKVLSSDGWLKTGDVGYVDEEGYIFIVDRKKDMVISGGENIYCAEVERAIGEMDGISECATFGIPDERLGELLVAIVRQDGDLTESDIISAVGEKLARYKAPATVIFSNEALPRNSVGKVDKKQLRADWPRLSGAK